MEDSVSTKIFKGVTKTKRLGTTALNRHTSTFDMEKTLPLPHLHFNEVFYLRQSWLYSLKLITFQKSKVICTVRWKALLNVEVTKLEVAC